MLQDVIKKAVTTSINKDLVKPDNDLHSATEKQLKHFLCYVHLCCYVL